MREEWGATGITEMISNQSERRTKEIILELENAEDGQLHIARWDHGPLTRRTLSW